jgi:hypothetical protein
MLHISVKDPIQVLEMPWSLAERNLANGENAKISSAKLPGLIICVELECLSENSRQ